MRHCSDPGASTTPLLYSAWRFFEDGEPQNWYLNFEAPLVRRVDAIDTLDYGLDLVLRIDGTTAWKDLEDLAPMIRTGRMTVPEVVNVLEAAEQVSHDLATGERWWSAWDRWRPPSISRRARPTGPPGRAG